jgi:hypothetical protein
MQANRNIEIVLIILGVVLILGAIYMTNDEPVDVNVPTAAEIAANVVIPITTVDVPSIDTGLLDDLLEGVYPDLVDDLEDDCTSNLWNEYENDYLDDIEDILGGDDEVKDISIVDYDYSDNYDFTVIDLGLDDEEDRAAELETTLRVRYKEVFGDSDFHFTRIDVEATCSDWDTSNNEFDDLNVIYS